LAGGMDLPASVAPFILRGVSLVGVDSVMAPRELRLEAWQRIAADLDRGKLERLTTTIGFDGIVDAAMDIVEGRIRGRVVVEMSSGSAPNSGIAQDSAGSLKFEGSLESFPNLSLPRVRHDDGPQA